MRVCVTGSRKSPLNKKEFVWEALDDFHTKNNIHLLIQGGADGIDSQAQLWAFSKGIPCATVHAQWSYYGRFTAGPIRNHWMAHLFNIEHLIAFPPGNGTSNMIEQAKKCSIPVTFVKDQ